jgi:SAM-dependent methyltransferase
VLGVDAVSVHVPSADRMAFLAERRVVSVHRFDTVHSSHYDQYWGAIGTTHAEFVTRLTRRVRAGGEVLDAACGTGKYWPALLAAGLQVMGTDQSAGMLAQASRKHPGVAVRVLALQDLAVTADLAGRFDGVLCVDALECVAPEHWPGVAAGLAGAVRTGAPAYVTVELPAGPLPAATDPRQVPGEVIEGGGYHYYPSRPQVHGWLEGAGFAVADQEDDGEYRHLLLTRT